MPQNGTARSGARKHISASSLAALECTYCTPENENAEPVCNRYSKVFGQCVELGDGKE